MNGHLGAAMDAQAWKGLHDRLRHAKVLYDDGCDADLACIGYSLKKAVFFPVGTPRCFRSMQPLRQ
jgi:hypothetical protein